MYFKLYNFDKEQNTTGELSQLHLQFSFSELIPSTFKKKTLFSKFLNEADKNFMNACDLSNYTYSQLCGCRSRLNYHLIKET